MSTSIDEPDTEADDLVATSFGADDVEGLRPDRPRRAGNRDARPLTWRQSRIARSRTACSRAICVRLLRDPGLQDLQEVVHRRQA